MEKTEPSAPEALQNTRPMGLAEAAAFTGYSPKYIYKLVHLGMIPHYKPTGGRLCFKLEELESFMFRERRAADYELEERAEQFLTRSKK